MPLLIAFFITLLCPPTIFAKNDSISSFSKAKKQLLSKVYYDHRQTIYCNAPFTMKKKVLAPRGFQTDKYVKRAKRIEWEHIVPAENFGRSFVEWREGDTQCRDSKGRNYKGRKCASKASDEFRYMQADLYNLYPAIGAVNARRSNYDFTLLSEKNSSFGSCEMIISKKKVQPPQEAMGRIARTYLYMDWAYAKYSMSRQQKQLVTAWDKMYPVSDWECTRAKRIEQIQGNSNPFVRSHCL